MVESIIHQLHHHSKVDPDKTAFSFLDENEQEVDSLSYQQLLDESQHIASFLQNECEPKDRVLLLFQPGLDYIRALFACFIAGVIAVPLYPPRRNKKAERILRVAESCNHSLILCSEQDTATILKSFETSESNTISEDSIRLHSFEAIKKITAESTNTSTGEDTQLSQIASQDIAFLQYTSGSTGTPKGVVINHENIIGNVDALTRQVQSTDQDTFVNWLPLFHDLGLITAVLWPVYLGATSILMSPAHFVRSPILWLNAITRYQGSICGAPNFAFQLCCDKIASEHLSHLDLSSWRVAYNAAEPIQADTVSAFAQKFASAQLTSAAQLGSYGMAEATAFISCGKIEKEILTYGVDADALTENKLVIADQTSQKSQILIGCGQAAETHDIRIVDPNTRKELHDEHIGEIWFAGPSVAQGYWQLPDITETTFRQNLEGRSGAYMRTGDLGFIYKDEIFVTGRMKDLIILEGRNYYPQDIEWHVENTIEEVAAFSCAAFSYSRDDSDQSEKLAIVAEIQRSAVRRSDFNQVIRHIRQQVVSEFYIYPALVVLVKPLSMPKTSSGKIQRQLTQNKLQQNELTVLAHSDDLSNTEYVPPVSEHEKQLCRILSRILKIDTISIVDSFFDIGGESITGTELISEIKETFSGVEISFEQLFSSPSIRELADYIEKRERLEILHNNMPSPSATTEEFEL